MELIYLAVAVAVVFLCLFCFMKGVKVGRAIKDEKPLPKLVDAPVIVKKKQDDELSMENQLNSLFGFEAKHTETRGIK